MEHFDSLIEFKGKYKEFVEFLIQLQPTDKKTFEKALELLENDEHLKNLTSEYIGRINSKERYKRQLLERDKKLFYRGSHDKSLVVIPNIGMKSILSRVLSISDEKEIWGYLQLFYIILEQPTTSSKKYIKALIGSIEKQDRINDMEDKQSDIEPEQNIQQHLDSCKSGNELVDNMVQDIASVFQNNFDTSGDKTNPMGAIFNTLNVISDKYTSKLSSGQITLSDMLSSLVKLNSSIKDKETDGDTDTVPDLTPVLEKMIKSEQDGKELDPTELLNDLAKGSGINMGEMVGQLLGSENGVGSILSNMFGGDNSNSNVPAVPLTEEQIKEMEQFYASMSLGKDDSSSDDNNVEK